MKKISFRAWLSIVTFVLIGLILVASQKELLHAWRLLQQVNMWLLVLVFPVAAIGYLAAGEMIFSYLRQKGFVRDVSPFTLMRLSLELNFVNHAFPSGGVSGISYVNWRLRKYGVSTGRATMAQVVRYIMGFVAVGLFLAISVVIVTIDGSVNRWIILMSSGLVTCLTVVTMIGFYFISSPSRLRKAAEVMARGVNGVARRVFRRRTPVLQEAALNRYFVDMHNDFLELRQDKKLLWQPFIWSIIFTTMEILPFWMTFQSLGVAVNPASIFIAYGVATTLAVVVATPGGAGAYEAAMVGILALSGVSQGQAIAGTVLYRVIAIVTTLVFGYVFYQLTILRYGKRTRSASDDQRQ